MSLFRIFNLIIFKWRWLAIMWGAVWSLWVSSWRMKMRTTQNIRKSTSFIKENGVPQQWVFWRQRRRRWRRICYEQTLVDVFKVEKLFPLNVNFQTRFFCNCFTLQWKMNQNQTVQCWIYEINQRIKLFVQKWDDAKMSSPTKSSQSHFKINKNYFAMLKTQIKSNEIIFKIFTVHIHGNRDFLLSLQNRILTVVKNENKKHHNLIKNPNWKRKKRIVGKLSRQLFSQ